MTALQRLNGVRERASAALLALLALAMAAGPSVGADVWEAHADVLHGHAWHWVLVLTAGNHFERTQLSDDPLQPFLQETGAMAVSGDTMTLEVPGSSPIGNGQYLRLPDGRLRWRHEPDVEMEPSRAVAAGDMLGTWQLSVGGLAEGGRIRLNADGTYDADLAGSTEHGPYRLAGTAMVHWPTQASDPSMLGIPGVWRDIRVEAGVLHYILRTGTIVRGECLAESVVMPVSWGDLKVARRVR